MNSLLTDIPDGSGLDNDPGTWVDLSIANSVLAGGLLIVAALWAVYILNRLWQGSLYNDARGGVEAAHALGLQLAPTGLRARLVATGAVGDQPVRVEWRGGVRGARSLIHAGAERHHTGLIDSAAALEAALAEVGVSVPLSSE